MWALLFLFKHSISCVVVYSQEYYKILCISSELLVHYSTILQYIDRRCVKNEMMRAIIEVLVRKKNSVEVGTLVLLVATSSSSAIWEYARLWCSLRLRNALCSFGSRGSKHTRSLCLWQRTRFRGRWHRAVDTVALWVTTSHSRLVTHSMWCLRLLTDSCVSDTAIIDNYW